MDNATAIYYDIIFNERHVSPDRPHMSNYDRAAQFAPYAALVGFYDDVAETERLVDEESDISDEEIEVINQKLAILAPFIKEQPEISVTYFVPDSKKDGGAYVTENIKVKKIDDYNKEIVTNNNKRIKIDEVVDINSDIFNSYF